MNHTVLSLVANNYTLFVGTAGLSVWKYDLTATGVSEFSSGISRDLSLLTSFPTPATNPLTIDRTNLSNFTDSSPVTYTLTTLTGEKLAEYEQNAAQFNIPVVVGIGSGVYFLTAVQGASRVVVMMTVEK